MTVIAREIADLSIDTSFSAWAYQVLKNRMLAYFKAKKVQEDRRANESDGDTAAFYEVNPELTQQLRECLRKVGSANQRYARVLALHYQGYTTNEICDRLNIKEGNFYMLLSRARQMLMTCLSDGEECHDEV